MNKDKKKIVVFKNKDKEGWYEDWYNRRDWLNFPHPYRCLISANPGSGKTNMIKNLILRAKPYFKKIFLCHYDLETKEYDDVDVIKLVELPDARSKDFTPSKKNLLIVDDYDFVSLNKYQMSNLRSLFKYASTHKGLSIIIATQDFFNIPSLIRRLSNIYFIWKGSGDLDSLYNIGRRVGYTKPEFKQLLDMCTNRFDNICIDMTVNTPAPVRLNGYTLIKSVNESFKAQKLKEDEERKLAKEELEQLEE